MTPRAAASPGGRRTRRPAATGPTIDPPGWRPLKRRMEFRTLGRSGLQVPVLSLGTGTFGGEGDFFKAWGSSDVAEATRLVDVCLDAGLTLFDSADVYSGGAGRGDPRPSDSGPSGQGPDFDEGHVPHRQGPERRRQQPPAPDRRRPRQPQAARDRLRRPLPAARVRRRHPRRGGDRHARWLRQGGQDPLHRLQQLLRLAPDEVARLQPPARAGPVRGPPGVLLAGWPGLRVGADAPGRRPGRFGRRLEPAGMGPADGARSAAVSRCHQTAG